MMSACRICASHLEEASIAEARNVTRLLHLADLADGMGDHELGAVLRDQAADEALHASRLYELASPDDVDLVTGAPVRSPEEVLEAAVTFARCQAEETSPLFAALAQHPGCEVAAEWFERHAEACRTQVATLEALRTRTRA
jgi:rubrerythrin